MLIHQLFLDQSLHGIPSRVELGRIRWHRKRSVTVRLRCLNQLRLGHALRTMLVQRPQPEQQGIRTRP